MAEDPAPSSGPAAAVAPPPAVPSPRPPWGPWASLAGTALAAGVLPATLVLALVASAALRLRSGLDLDPSSLAPGGRLVAGAVLVAAPPAVGLLAFLARARGWRPGAYLALRPGSRRASVLAILGLVLALTALDGLTAALGRPVVVPLLVDAALAGPLWLGVVAVAVVMPAVEEVLLRGFLYRGVADSPRLGPGVAIGVAALVGAALHGVGQDLYGVATVYLLGLYLGLVRHQTGSTSLTILLHAIANAVTAALAISAPE